MKRGKNKQFNPEQRAKRISQVRGGSFGLVLTGIAVIGGGIAVYETGDNVLKSHPVYSQHELNRQEEGAEIMLGGLALVATGLGIHFRQRRMSARDKAVDGEYNIDSYQGVYATAYPKDCIKKCPYVGRCLMKAALETSDRGSVTQAAHHYDDVKTLTGLAEVQDYEARYGSLEAAATLGHAVGAVGQCEMGPGKYGLRHNIQFWRILGYRENAFCTSQYTPGALGEALENN